MSQPDFNDALENVARSLVLGLGLPDTAIPMVFKALSAAYFLGFEAGLKHVLKSYDKYFESLRHD